MGFYMIAPIRNRNDDVRLKFRDFGGGRRKNGLKIAKRTAIYLQVQ